jgi:hypothetical protein
MTGSPSPGPMIPLTHFMSRFARRKQLSRKRFDGVPIELEFRDDHDRPRLFCSEPVVVARFISAVRQEIATSWPGAHIYLRGQSADYVRLLPSLLRHAGLHQRDELLAAEQHLEVAIARHMRPHRRFERPILAALLQHYGVATTWLDVVDDLRMAVWFATHNLTAHQIQRRVTGTGWIYLISTMSDRGTLQLVDLRSAHNALSLRPQTQQGLSLRAPGCDFTPYIAATVEFPISDRWHLEGLIHTGSFVFPPETVDHTLRLLNRRCIERVLRQIETQCSLSPMILGNISAFTHSADIHMKAAD